MTVEVSRTLLKLQRNAIIFNDPGLKSEGSFWKSSNDLRQSVRGCKITMAISLANYFDSFRLDF
jgi:hypothetical protein